MPTLSQYQAMLKQYMSANPPATSTAGMSFAGNPQDWSPAEQQAMGQQSIDSTALYNKWLNSLPPEQQAEFQRDPGKVC